MVPFTFIPNLSQKCRVTLDTLVHVCNPSYVGDVVMKIFVQGLGEPLKITKTRRVCVCVGGVAHVAEHLPSKCKALDSKPSIVYLSVKQVTSVSFLFVIAGDQFQGHMHARQDLYHQATFLSPNFYRWGN
jgi:hypothetical protein